MDIKHINSSLQSAFYEMKLQLQQQASQQQKYDATLAEILELLKKSKTASAEPPNIPTAQDDPPKQPTVSGGSSGAAGKG